jgi:hypothetical protein
MSSRRTATAALAFGLALACDGGVARAQQRRIAARQHQGLRLGRGRFFEASMHLLSCNTDASPFEIHAASP